MALPAQWSTHFYDVICMVSCGRKTPVKKICCLLENEMEDLNKITSRDVRANHREYIPCGHPRCGACAPYSCDIKTLLSSTPTLRSVFTVVMRISLILVEELHTLLVVVLYSRRLHKNAGS